jgi:hypothetical protein
MRMYHLEAVNEKTGQRTRLTRYAMTHAQCCAMKSKFTSYPARRIERVEAE